MQQKQRRWPAPLFSYKISAFVFVYAKTLTRFNIIQGIQNMAVFKLSNGEVRRRRIYGRKY